MHNRNLPYSDEDFPVIAAALLSYANSRQSFLCSLGDSGDPYFDQLRDLTAHQIAVVTAVNRRLFGLESSTAPAPSVAAGSFDGAAGAAGGAE